MLTIKNNKMYRFKLKKTQIKKFEKWKKIQLKKESSNYAAGERWTFMFTSTGLGLLVSAKDNITENSIDLTDWDNF